MNLEVGVYQDASAGGSQGNKLSSSTEHATEALEHMVAALQILDDSDIPAAVGARLDHAIEILREEIVKRS